MNQVLHHSLPLASDVPFSSDQECIEHIGAHAHHSSGLPGHSASSHSLGQFSSRYPRPDAPSYPHHQGTGLSDSGSSISASPSSNASSVIAYPPHFNQAATGTYPHPYTLTNNVPNFYSNFGNMSSTRRMSSLTESSQSGMLPPTTRSPGMGNPVSPSPLGASAREHYTTGTPGLHRHPHTLSPRHSDISRYSSLPDTPRSVLPTTMPLSSGSYGASMMNYQSNSSETPPFHVQETYNNISCEGNPITPNIEAKIDKGFFYSSDNVWTCYRRNYFSVTVSYSLSPWLQNARLYLEHGGGKPAEQIQALAVSLAAAVDGSTGKSIELIQHTPKRDKGPQLQMKKELLSPTPPNKTHDHSGYGIGNNYAQSAAVPGPQLPLQNEPEATQQYAPTSHANSNFQHGFERIQFKSATANNGKRRAQQQYYHLIVELWANVQSTRETEARWVKVAARSSHPVVVRGRSPSHYQNEGPHNASASRGGGSAGMGGPGSHLGSNGRTAYGSGYGNGMSGSGGGAMGSTMYRGNTYSLDPSPVGSHSVSSASSLSGGPVEGLAGESHMVDDEDAKMIDAPNEYQYFPSPLYENMPQKVEGHGLPHLPLPDRRIKEEYPGPSSMATGWQVGGCGRFQGLDSSRGYYPPDVHTHTGY